MKVNLSKFEILICLLGILAINSFGQDKCNLQISVYEFKEDGSSEQFPVRDAKIQLVNSKTKKSLKISKNTEVPTFADAPEGEYQVTVSKEGFQKTVNGASVDCSPANTENTFPKIVFLWKGSSKQTKEMSAESYSVGDKFKAKEKNPTDNGAVLLVKPEYPIAARAVRATGAVGVQITINELGYVISAKAISGHPLLQSAAVGAAIKSKFRMTLLNGMPVKVTGVVVYNFAP